MENWAENNKNETLETLGLVKDRVVSIQKQKVNENENSKVEVGALITGLLIKDVKIGSPICFDNGANTTSISDVFQENGKYYAKTRTSVYEIILDLEDKIQGLELNNKYGNIHTPFDAKLADLRNEVIDKPFKTNEDEDYSFYINKEKLKGTLLEVNGAELFRVMQGRFVVVTRVGEGHLPFYISSAGTSGKRAGEWYPFFGYTGDWIVKGDITSKQGDMEYSQKISEVQNILNENLRFPSRNISPKGKFGTGKGENQYEPEKVYAELGDYLKYQNIMFQDNWKDKSEKEFVQRITGYNPEKVANNGKGSAKEWIKSIVNKL